MPRFEGTEGNDSYTLHANKRDHVHMLGGDDTVILSAASLSGEDRIDAGRGDYDNAVLTDGGVFYLLRDHFVGFESMTLTGSGMFYLGLDDSVTQAGQTMLIDARSVTGSLTLSGSAERDGSFLVIGSAADDSLVGGSQADQFQAGLGRDVETGNGGADSFVFEADDQGRDRWGKDRITDFRTGEDHLIFKTDSAHTFDDLIIRFTTDGLMIRTPRSSSSVTLAGVLPEDLHASDVVFYPAGAGLHDHAPMFLGGHGLLA